MTEFEDKDAARQVARSRRAAADIGSITRAIVGHLSDWAEIGDDAVVLGYVALPDEPDIEPILGARGLITRTHDDGTLTLHSVEADRERHPFGFDQPVADAPAVDPHDVDVVLVPGLAFAADGTRLGRGAGYYDRLLRRLRPDALLVGVALDAVVAERLPHDDHDVPMTHIVTESGIRPVGRFAEVEDLRARTRSWIAGDPDPDTRDELQALLDADDLSELEARMGSDLRFGTAGIRGEVGAGSARMNRAVVIRTTAGLADYLQSQGRGGQTVVVGYDGRTSSRAFAEDTVGVLVAAGFDVRYFDGTAPTPLVSFAAKEVGATAAVVVTASHNPPADNGYKVYDSNSAQIIPPVDGAISSAIENVGPATEVPRVPGALAGGIEGAEVLFGIEDRYLEAVSRFRSEPAAGGPVHIAYTAMHGVGGPLTLKALGAAGHASVAPVPEQFEPDGTFPTVSFPNPEEPGAMDLVEALGADEHARLAIANDPDADRLGVSVRDEDGWRRLSGNEIGILLADFALRRVGRGAGDLVINSIVSSPMLGSIAAAHGARWEQTLTGFKWITNAAMDLEADGLRFVFGYEEALGYTVGPVVRDKDGISAAVWFADLAAAEAEHGRSVLDRLSDLWDEHGLWMSAQHSVRRPGAEGAVEIAAAMGRLRTDPPAAIGDRQVMGVDDFAEGAGERPRWLPATNLLVLRLEGGSRVLARPSGTEPKLKFYADVKGSGQPEEVAGDARELAAGLAVSLDLE